MTNDQRKVYQQLDANWDGICSGCGASRPCSHSHLVPISFDKKLRANILNIVFHCSECHSAWESHDKERMVKLLDYEDNMERVKKLSPVFYRLITT